ncbi:restriction endonuclease subunit S [Clostridium sp. JNZ J1-5]
MSFSEWKEVALGEVAKVTKLAGFEFTKHIEYVEDGEIIAIRALNVKNGTFDLSDVKRIKKDVSQGLTRSKLYKDDIVLTYTGAKFGEVAIVKYNDKFHLAPNVAKVTVEEEYNAYFIYSFLRSQNFRQQLINYAGGSSQPTIPMMAIRQLKVPVPPLQEQKVIADTLSCLDNKIELNNRINKTLEEMSQAIFKSWFVDFEPFQDGEFEDSELGIIPKGWKINSLYDFAGYINGASFKKDEYATSGCPIIKITELKNGITSSTEYFSGTKDEKYYIKTGDILFSWSGNPQTSIDTFIWVGGDAILNQHTFKISIKNNDYCFIYLLLKFFKPEFTRIASSKQTTGLGHITVSDLKRIKFPYNDKVVDEFCIILNPVIEMYVKNLIENEKLREIRDTLLPKLMSGEIRGPIEEVQ